MFAIVAAVGFVLSFGTTQAFAATQDFDGPTWTDTDTKKDGTYSYLNSMVTATSSEGSVTGYAYKDSAHTYAQSEAEWRKKLSVGSDGYNSLTIKVTAAVKDAYFVNNEEDVFVYILNYW